MGRARMVLALLSPLLLLLLPGLAPVRAFEINWSQLEGLARGKVESCGG